MCATLGRIQVEVRAVAIVKFERDGEAVSIEVHPKDGRIWGRKFTAAHDCGDAPETMLVRRAPLSPARVKAALART